MKIVIKEKAYVSTYRLSFFLSTKHIGSFFSVITIKCLTSRLKSPTSWLVYAYKVLAFYGFKLWLGVGGADLTSRLICCPSYKGTPFLISLFNGRFLYNGGGAWLVVLLEL